MTYLETGHVIRLKADPKQKGLVRHLIDPNTIRVMWDEWAKKDTLEKPGDFEVQIRQGRHLVWVPAAPTVKSRFF